MNTYNARKRRVLLELLNRKRIENGQQRIKTIRGFNKVFGTKTAETDNIMDALVNRVGVTPVVYEEQVVPIFNGENLEYTARPPSNIDAITELYWNNRGKIMTFVYKNGAGMIVKNITTNIPNFVSKSDFDDWLARGEIWHWRNGTDDDIFKANDYTGYIYVFSANDVVTAERIKQAYLDGIKHCVFTPIMKWAQTMADNCDNKNTQKKYDAMINKLKKMETQYNNGVPEEYMDAVCEKLNVRITVNQLFSEDTKTFGTELKQPRRTFTFTNTRVNHLDFGLFNDAEMNAKATQVSANELDDMMADLDSKGEFYLFKKRNARISTLITNNGNYCVFQEMDEIKNSLENDTGINNIKFDAFQNKDLFEFISRGTHFNCSVMFENYIPYKGEHHTITGLKVIDQRKAYFNFNKCKYYEGFLGKVTDLRKTNKIMGVGFYLIDNLKFNIKKANKKFVKLNERMRMYKSKNVYSSAELKMLKDMGYCFDIIAGAWGIKPFDFEFSDDCLRKIDKVPYMTEDGTVNMKGKSIYALLTGMWSSYNEEINIYSYGTQKQAEFLAAYTNEKIKYTKETNEICFIQKRTSMKNPFQISAGILAYQRLSLLEQLLEMDYDKLQAIYVDGIYYIDHPFKLLDTFSDNKDLDTYSNMSFVEGIPFITNTHKEYPNIKFAEQRDHYSIELFKGAGGCGKTHMNLVDKGLQNIVYSAISHKLNATKKDEYSVDVVTWAGLVGKNHDLRKQIMRDYSVLIIDEVSMMSNEMKTQIIDEYGGIMKIIFCGDIGYQLPAIEGKEFNCDRIDHVRILDKNYRVQCDKLDKLLKQIRDDIHSMSSIKKHVEQIQHISVSKMLELYKPEDMILAYSNKLCDMTTEHLKHLDKWYFKVGNDKYLQGMIIVGGEQPEGSIRKHCYTVHCIQGETASHNLFIFDEVFAYTELAYTAISRAKKLSQIFIVV